MASYLPSLPTILGPVHIISYATLLGTEIYQSFINTKVCYQVLPRPAFTSLQQTLFPIYFKTQSIMLLITALTYPLGPISLMKSPKTSIPFAIAALTAVLNLVVYGPRTRKAMLDRFQMGTSVEEFTEEMRHDINRGFSRNHAMSIHLNLIGILATLFHGVSLGSMIRV